MHRGDIYLVDLSNQVGSEQQGVRPALIIQNDTGNNYSPTTIICPITSRSKTAMPTHVELKPDECDIEKESIVLCEQVRVIDKSRLKRKLGQVTNQNLINDINRKLMISIGVCDGQNN